MTFDLSRHGRVTLGLYNAYDPKTFREPHRRVIARAGDLALAFGMNLALFGFPVPETARTPQEIAAFIAGTTSIGAHGDNFVRLADLGRFQKFPYPDRGFPPQLGKVVLTTCKPDPKKQVTVKQLADMLENGQSLLVLFGIGPHGVPKEVRPLSAMDFEVTDGNYSLETCTALGAVCGVLHNQLKQ
ncbi:MAG: DUF531 domain-containing protein [Candidatus Methanomethylophilus sp.]|nr:DUF531 domain-containing protein [Methanomethylophilus sp.]MDD4669090.1 DUF531 domain-containing protein [Methanomethylophilus sp.]